ncbi:hypothetical protein [Helicobacter pylori]|uniref:hypothetical protein n=1 Tax=Helicobacter pylori TaxID=210 RepID=UPI000EABD0D0
MKNEKILRKIETKLTLSNHYRNDNSVSNLNGNNPTTRKFKPPKQKSQISLVFGMNALVPLGTI